jgi:hypothetical protein
MKNHVSRKHHSQEEEEEEDNQLAAPKNYCTGYDQ